MVGYRNKAVINRAGVNIVSGIPMVGYRNEFNDANSQDLIVSGIPMVGYRNNSLSCKTL